MNIIQLHKRIYDFVLMYGSCPPEKDESKALELISDYLLIMNAELSFKPEKIDHDQNR